MWELGKSLGVLNVGVRGVAGGGGYVGGESLGVVRRVQYMGGTLGVYVSVCGWGSWGWGTWGVGGGNVGLEGGTWGRGGGCALGGVHGCTCGGRVYVGGGWVVVHVGTWGFALGWVHGGYVWRGDYVLGAGVLGVCGGVGYLCVGGTLGGVHGVVCGGWAIWAGAVG